MYRVKMNHLRRNMHFVIMKSVFNTDKVREEGQDRDRQIYMVIRERE
jgi:hypothetical protein